MTDLEGRRMLSRMTWLGVWLAAAGAFGLLIVKGPRWGAGFLLGAAVSLLGLEWWKAILRGFDSSGKRPAAASTILLMLRLPVLAALIYGIVRFTGVASGAVIGGLLVS